MLEGLDDAEFAEAGTVEQALLLCREQRFDAYLVDIHLTENRLERGGIEFIKQVRNVQAAPSVVVRILFSLPASLRCTRVHATGIAGSLTPCSCLSVARFFL